MTLCMKSYHLCWGIKFPVIFLDFNVIGLKWRLFFDTVCGSRTTLPDSNDMH